MQDRPPGQTPPPDDAEEREPDRTIIDVSGDRPEVVESEDDSQPFYSQVRIYTARGGRGSCLIPLVLLGLLLCCSCVGAWAIADNLF